MRHWSDAYLGLPYVAKVQDCAWLAEKVRAEVFGRAPGLPAERNGGPFGLSAQIGDLTLDFAEPTDNPKDGDAVLLWARGRLRHIAIYCVIGGAVWVLHNDRGAGQVVRTRWRDLERLGYPVEGVYRWK